jgi:hypothetical protein
MANTNRLIDNIDIDNIRLKDREGNLHEFMVGCAGN